MTPMLWAATEVVQTEATNPDTAAPASASRRFVSMLIIVVRRSFNATIGGDDYHDHRKRTLLRASREWPRRRPAAEQGDELAARPHSITSSARPSSVADTSRPSTLAVYQERRPANTLSRYHHEISCVSAYLIMAASVSGPTMPSMSPW